MPDTIDDASIEDTPYDPKNPELASIQEIPDSQIAALQCMAELYAEGRIASLLPYQRKQTGMTAASRAYINARRERIIAFHGIADSLDLVSVQILLIDEEGTEAKRHYAWRAAEAFIDSGAGGKLRLFRGGERWKLPDGREIWWANMDEVRSAP